MLRVSLKALPFEDKLTTTINFLGNNPNRAMKERVLNYLQGLSMAYKGESRAQVKEVYDELLKFDVDSISPDASQDFKSYSEKGLLKVAQDLMVRTTKWLRKGYNHVDQNTFIMNLLNHLIKTYRSEKANQLKIKLENLIKESNSLTNTHKFFF